MRIGLTGNIACGKSTVTHALAQVGVKVIDADKISHEIGGKGVVRDAIVDTFGTTILDENSGDIVRKRLGQIVFGNPEKLKRLESIMLPFIYEEIEAQVARHPNCILDSFRIFDTPLEKLVDEVWIVDCPKDIQLERLMKRNDLSKEEALQRINAQIPVKKFMDRAAVYYNNYGTEKELIEYFFPKYLKKQGIGLASDWEYWLVEG